MKLEFVEKKHEVGKIYSFFFESEDLKDWQAGQYLNITMPDVPPSVADRLFTIASAPCEKIIQIVTVIGPSLYKQKLNQLKSGEAVEADQLGGDFTWVDDGRKKLFLAGGIGIPPFLSIVRDNLAKNIPLEASLMYAGKKDRRAFVEELKDASTKDRSLKLSHYINKRLTIEEIERQIPDYKNRLIYLAGSQDFVESLGEGLMHHGLPRGQLKYDWFDGFTDKAYQ